MAVLLSAYMSVLGRTNYLNQERLFRLLEGDTAQLPQYEFEFAEGAAMVAAAVGCALTVAIGK
jgi:hypothetical protein